MDEMGDQVSLPCLTGKRELKSSTNVSQGQRPEYSRTSANLSLGPQGAVRNHPALLKTTWFKKFKAVRSSLKCKMPNEDIKVASHPPCLSWL
jgi:hypothetical protein